MKKIFQLTAFIVLLISCDKITENSKTELPYKNPETKSVTIEDKTAEKDSEKETEKYDWSLILNRIDNYKTISNSFSDKKLIPTDFKDFSKNFITDQDFQKKHIDFDNLLGLETYCIERKEVGKENWIYDDWDFLNALGTDEKYENVFYFSDSIFYLEYRIKEVGSFRHLGFEKVNDEWYLTLYFVDNC